MLACNLSPDLFSQQEEIRGMAEARVTAAATATLGPVTVSVAPDGTGDYPSLEAAVEAVPEGSTIILEAGTFLLTEPLSVTKALSLVGAGMDRTEVVAEARDSVVYFDGKGLFAAQGITFRHRGDAMAHVAVVDGGEINFTLCRFIDGVWDEEEGRGGDRLLLRESTEGRVRDCRMEENGFDGIEIQDQAQPTLEGNTCTGNEENGIAYFGDAGGTAQGNECSDNSLQGISVNDQAKPVLEDNVCTVNTECGIAYIEDGGGVARRNECARNGLHGIGVHDRAQPTLEGNTCTGNEQTGIAYLHDSGGTAQDNECSDNGPHGIAVTDQAQPTLEGNTCARNQECGIIYLNNSGGVARENECSGNQWGIWVQETANPELVDNDCHDNSEANVDDRRQNVQSTTPQEPTITPEPSFGPITFSLDVVEDTNAPINPATTFPAGTTRVAASYDYQGMADDIEWTRTWYHDGVEVVSTTLRWDEDPGDPTWQGGMPRGR